MKLVTYQGPAGPALGIVENGVVIDVGVALASDAGLRELPDDLPVDMIDLIGRGPAWLAALATAGHALAASVGGHGVIPLEHARLRAPILRPPKIVCVGLNYADHAREQGIQPPAAPVLFLKASNTISGPGDPIRIPPNTSEPDYEAEMAVVIGKGGSRIAPEHAMEHVAGYTILNDVTARDLQHSDKQWFRGKSCDTFAPTGPWIVTADEIADPHHLAISLTLNGVTMQESNTSNLIHRIDFLISYLSQSLTWETGDILSTGTPPGVGVFRKPPVFIKPGDTITITVEGIGSLTNPAT